MNKKNFENPKDFAINDDEYMKKKEVLTSFFSDSNYSLMTLKQIAYYLGVNKKEIYILEDILHKLEEEGVVFVDDSKRYVPTSKNSVFKCIFEKKSDKYGFARVENGEDIYVDSSLSLGAMNKDEVLVKKITQGNGSNSSEGQVIKILKRNTKMVIGRFIKNRNFGFVEPIDRGIQDIYIPKKHLKDFNNNDIVKVEILKYATATTKMEGKIIETIGSSENDKTYIDAMYDSYSIKERQQFSELVLNEVKDIPQTIEESNFKNREDRTNEVIVTIDGDDAKDLDDAISIKKIDDKYILSVYIADVSHYVKEGANLNTEAINRGTSTYIPGTVIPMLPKELSNGICSLNEGVNRLALAIDITFDRDGNALESRIFKAVIKVSKRMSYDKVYKVLNLEDMEVLKEYQAFEKELFLMKDLALLLMKKREEEGSISFDIKETKVVLDEKGNVVDIKPYDITIANKIIEEFMLAANMQIAEKFYFLEMPFIYRIHEKPDEEKLRDLNEILAGYGKKIKGIKNVHPKTLADILKNIEDAEEKQVVSSYMLRTLKLARYSEECLGHFGLASKYYCHFTSPIRRYPDLFIHRIISDYIESNYILSEDKINKYQKQASIYSKLASDMEKEATQIERDFDDLYKTIYMSRYMNEEFNAIVSSVNSFGMFVRLENTVEGLVPFDNMENDYYIFDEVRRTLVGERTGEVYKVGDKLKVSLTRCDIKTKQIDFKIISRG